MSRVLLVLGVAIGYMIAGKLGLSLAQVHPSASAVWPPTGLALAACLLWGRTVWPAIFAAALVVNVTTAGTVWTSLGIAAGNTLEAIAGSYLLVRMGGGAQALRRPDGVIKFAVSCAVLAPAVSATVGVTALSVAGFSGWDQYGAVWATWWLGDMAGALLVAPPLLLLFGSKHVVPERRRLVELAILMASLSVVAQGVFGGWSLVNEQALPLEYLPIPLLIWAAFRFGPGETAAATGIVAAIALAGTTRGTGPFAAYPPNQALLLLQAFMATTSLMSLTLAAAVMGRRSAEEAARATQEKLVLIQRQQRAEEALAAAQAIAHIGSWEWDIAGDTVTWSDELYRIYGAEPGAFPVTYKEFLARVHPDDRVQVDRTVTAAYEQAAPFEFFYRVIRPGGEVRVLHARGDVLTGDDGRPVRMVGTGQDVTALKQAEHEREQLILERAARAQAEQRAVLLEEVGRLKEEFIATASHDLKTPLATIQGHTQLLGRQLNDGESARSYLREALRAIEREVASVVQSLQRLLDVSRLEAGALQHETSEVDLREEVESAVARLRPVAGDRISVRRAGEGVVTGRWDKQRLGHLLANLLENALKYSGDNGRVEVTIYGRIGEVEVAVTDEGIGVAPEDLTRLFDRFYRTSDAVNTGVGGQGLGLYICKRIVESHGGRIWAESPGTGKGTAIRFTLPRGVPTIAEGQEASSQEGGPARPCVLIVDDEPSILRLLSILLQDAGYQVYPAQTAERALDIIVSLRPGLVLSDVKLPGIDGVELARRIKALPETAGIPVLLMGAVGPPATHAADAFIRKPFDADQVLALVNEHARRGV